MGYGKPVEINATVDLNSEWISDSEDNEYNYFKSDSYEVVVDEYGNSYSLSQCKVTWSNLTSVTFKYMSSSSSDIGNLFVSKLDGEKFTLQISDDDIYLSTFDKTPGTYNEFTIECDEGEHHIWFFYLKAEGATVEDRGFIGVPKSVRTVLDVKQGAELPMEYKYGGVSVENGKTYNINFNDVALPNGNIVTVYEDVEKIEKVITYEYVDLGLSVKWATCNIGASSETDYGVYFQWGETSGVSGSLVGKYSDENYVWASYKHCNGSDTTLKKYNTSISYGENPDNIETLESVDDAASQIMGDGWRMPTQNEIQELIDNTTNQWVTNYNGSGVNGRKFASKNNGNSIFIPAAGYCSGDSPINVGYDGYVWSSSLSTSDPYSAWYLNVNSGGCNMYNIDNRSFGLSVRGVRK